MAYKSRQNYDVFIHPTAGVGDYTSLTLALSALGSFGDDTTQYDITNPSGMTFRYTYDWNWHRPSNQCYDNVSR